jgi:putative acetyltransferase
MMIREKQRGDAAAVRRLLTSAFGDEGQVADLVDALDARPDRPAEGLVAHVDDTAVGYVQLSRGWIDADRELVETLILSPLGVLPARQRSGVGRSLCAAAVEQARALDAPAVFLEGNPAYYGRLGWEPASDHGFVAPSRRIPAPGFQVVRLPARQPWMTGAVVYNDTFWSCDLVGLRD